MIDLTIVPEGLERAVKRAREKSIIIPTFKQQKDPGQIPGAVVSKLKNIGLWDMNPLNLFRISWHNEPVAHGGGFGDVNFVEFPKELTGVDARIVSVIGKWFPTGAHKVGAAFGCLVPRLVTGQFDPSSQKAVWPSTGNYCRGGAYDSTLLGCESIAILPEGMSRERFEWLETVSGEIIKTPGSESNVKRFSINAGNCESPVKACRFSTSLMNSAITSGIMKSPGRLCWKCSSALWVLRISSGGLCRLQGRPVLSPAGIFSKNSSR